MLTLDHEKTKFAYCSAKLDLMRFDLFLYMDNSNDHRTTSHTKKSSQLFTTLINYFFNSILVSYKYFTSAMSNNVLKNRIGLIYILILLDCKA